jgi:hypothetical protein
MEKNKGKNGLFIACGCGALGVAVATRIFFKRNEKILADLKVSLKEQLLSDMDQKVQDFMRRNDSMIKQYIAQNFGTEASLLTTTKNQCEEVMRNMKDNTLIQSLSSKTEEYEKVMEERIKQITQDKIVELSKRLDERIQRLER